MFYFSLQILKLSSFDGDPYASSLQDIQLILQPSFGRFRRSQSFYGNGFAISPQGCHQIFQLSSASDSGKRSQFTPTISFICSNSAISTLACGCPHLVKAFSVLNLTSLSTSLTSLFSFHHVRSLQASFMFVSSSFNRVISHT